MQVLGLTPNCLPIPKLSRTWTADKMAWMIYLASTIVSLAFEPGALKQVEDDNLTDDEVSL